MRNLSSLFTDPLSWMQSIILVLPAILIAFTLHEFAHAWTAVKMGDKTPLFMGRVSLNPMKHIDWLGFVLLFVAGFGWGKPVMVNYDNFHNRRKGIFLVSIAGVTMNLILGVLFTLLYTVLTLYAPSLDGAIFDIIQYVCLYNFVLMIFNLIPLPPLDGSKVLSTIIWRDYRVRQWINTLERYGTYILFALCFLGAFRFIGDASFRLMDLLIKGFLVLFGKPL